WVSIDTLGNLQVNICLVVFKLESICHKMFFFFRSLCYVEQLFNRCANLTLVLDNWKYAIMTQVKDLLLHDHSTVLPDYGRIQPLSDALGDLYKEFNALKERLAELTTKFDGVESFVDDMRSGRKPAPLRGEPRPPGSLPAGMEAAAADARGRGQGRRTRVVVRRVKKPKLQKSTHRNKKYYIKNILKESL
uniref:Si:ch73-127m5.3 n=1 Tax=Sparus aurata TaxID=8175 RepID=A0A671XP24_SPAAU